MNRINHRSYSEEGKEMARQKREQLPVCKYNAGVDCKDMKNPKTVERLCEHCGWCPREQKRRKDQLRGLMIVD